jgi:hypothetical protein
MNGVVAFGVVDHWQRQLELLLPGATRQRISIHGAQLLLLLLLLLPLYILALTQQRQQKLTAMARRSSAYERDAAANSQLRCG